LNDVITLKYGLEVTQDHSNRSIRKLECGLTFLFAFHSNYGSILHNFRDNFRHWSKIGIFFHTPLYLTPPLRGSPLEYCHPAWCGKTRVVGLLNCEKTFIICVTVLDSIPLWSVTDGQTNGRTDILPRHSPRYLYALRGKNLHSRI